MWWSRRKRVREPSSGVKAATAARKRSEHRLAETQRTLTIPLARIREENHITSDIQALIQRRRQGE
jgi:hypothetical protein